MQESVLGAEILPQFPRFIRFGGFYRVVKKPPPSKNFTL